MATIPGKRGRRIKFVDGGTWTPPQPQTIQANRIAEWLFTEGSGQRVFNRAGANTSMTNLIGFSEGHWASVANYYSFSSYYNKSETTLTPDFANNENGKPQAARVETLSGSTVSGVTGAYAGMRIQGRDFPAGTYTMSLSVKSNTGSAQTMRMACTNTGPISGDLTVPTSWGRVSWTFTHPGGAVLLYFAINGSGGAAMDILIDKLKLETGSSATPYATPDFDLFFGIDGTTESIDPTWVTGGVALSDQFAFGYNIENPFSTTNFTIHVLAKLSSGFTEQAFVLATVFGDNVFELMMGVGGTADTTTKPAFRFGGTQIKAKILKLADDQVHLLTGTYDGTTFKFYVDKILFATATGTVGPVSIKRLQLGYNSLVGGLGFNGEVYYGGIYSAAHDITDITTQYAALKLIMTGRGITMNTSDDIFIMCEGDSITANPNNYPQKGIMAITAATLAENKAVVGDVVANLVSRASIIDSYYDATRAKNILSVLIGANDMSGATSAATFVANLKSYCQARQAVGWTVMVCTVLPNTNSGFNAKRNTANGLIVGDPSFYTSLCRFDLNSNMGNDSDASDTAKYSDGVHPTNAGYNFLYPTWVTAVTALF